MVSGLTDAVLEKLMTEESCRGEALSRELGVADRVCFAGWVSDMAAGLKPGITSLDWLGLALISFVLPGLLSWLFALPLRKWGWIKDDDLKLDL